MSEALVICYELREETPAPAFVSQVILVTFIIRFLQFFCIYPLYKYYYFILHSKKTDYGYVK